MARRRYTPKLKAQVVLEVLGGEKTPGQVAKAYGVHPNSVQLWKRRFVERAPEVFAEETTVNEYERRIRDLEQLLGKKEGGDRPSKKLLGPEGLSVEAKVALVSGTREAYGLGPSLRAVELAHSTWHHHTRTRVSYADADSDACRSPWSE